MISIFFLAVCVVLAILGGAGFGFWLQRHLSNKRIGDANDLAQRIVEEARKEAQAQKRKFYPGSGRTVQPEARNGK